jgi:hypothetical protein
MSVSIDVVLDIAQAEQAANRFQDEFIESAKNAAKSGLGYLKEYANASDAEYQKLFQSYKKVTEAQARVNDAAITKQRQDFEEAYQERVRMETQAAQRIIQNEARIASETEDYVKRVEEAYEQAIEERGQKMEKFANEARGFVGDVGDAVGQLGKGLLGLTEAQQLVADKTIYMTEKGMALGGALGQLAGPLGVLVGSGVGAIAGGLLGYFAGNQEAATIEAKKLTEAIDLQSRSVQKVIENWAKADAAKKGVISLSKSWDGLQEAIDKTINKEDLSKVKSSELDRRKKASLESLTAAQEGLGKKRQETDQIEIELSRLKAKDFEDQYEKAGLIIEQEQKLQKAQADFAQVQEVVTGKMNEYSDVTSEIEKRTQKAAKATKDFSAIIRDHADSLSDSGGGMGFMTEDTAEVQQKLAEDMQRLRAEELQKTLDQNTLAEEAEQRHQEAISNIKLQAFVRQMSEEDKRRKQEADEIQKYADGVNNALKGIGSVFSSEIAGVATNAFNSWLETIATGEKDADKSFKKIAAGAIRNIGSQLVADGTKNLLTGAANILTGTPPGAPLVAIGSAEIAAGVGMGAAGARAQRRQGYGQEKNAGGTQGNLGKAANTNNGTQVQAPTIINLGMLALTDQRHMELAGKQIAQAQKAYSQGRR